MKIKFAVIYFLLAIASLSSSAQKPSLDTGVLYRWPSVGEQGILSADGNYAGYIVGEVFSRNPVYYLKAAYSSWEKKLPGINKVEFTADSRKAIYQQGDNLHILTLGSDREEIFPQISSYQLFKKGKEEYLLYYSKINKKLTIRNGGKQHSYTDVDAWLLSTDGRQLLKKIIRDKDKQMLRLIDLETGQERPIWEGPPVTDWLMDDNGTQVAFITGDQNARYQIWGYKSGEEKARIIAKDQNKSIDQGLTIGSLRRFSKDGSRLFFNLKQESPKPDPNKVSVDVWSYRDAKLQSQQLDEKRSEQSYLSVIRLDLDFSILRLQQEGEASPTISPGGNYVVFNKTQGNRREHFFSTASQYQYDLVDSRTAKRVKINKYHFFGFSPSERFLELYDSETANVYTYELATGTIHPLTAKASMSKTLMDDDGASLKQRSAIFFDAWLPGDRGVLVNDYYDLWELDPLGKRAPKNLTYYEGAKTHTRFAPAIKYTEQLVTSDTLLLTAFNQKNKENGFYQLLLHKEQAPVKLTMGSYYYSVPFSELPWLSPVKASDASVYLVARQSIGESPNYFVTKDFKTFRPISDNHPEKNYNWMRSRLMSFKTTGGLTEQGVLYLPGDFDPAKKYPLIFHYYQRLSDFLNFYHNPLNHGSGGGLNDLGVAWFTSHGYLVFIPDFHFELGQPGASVLKTVQGAVKLLKTFPYVNSKHIGLQGHSYGGWETNYLITHSNTFAAAVSSAGSSDVVGEYSLLWGDGASKQDFIENGQGRMGSMLWERPDQYIENSPVFYANKVTTPLMLVANKNDGNVPFTLGLEFFTALRRLGKKAWMLQYDNGTHGELYPKDCIDYLLRSTQFFDHYLKGAPAPKWMVEGIPASKKQIDDGMELEPVGVEPGPGLLTPEAKKKADALQHKKLITITFN